MSSITKNKSFGQAFSSGKVPPPLFSILLYPNGWVSTKYNNQAKTKTKSFLSSFFSKKLAVSKGRAFGRSNERNGGVGAAAPALNGVQKSFLSNFFQKKFVRTKFAKQEQ